MRRTFGARTRACPQHQLLECANLFYLTDTATLNIRHLSAPQDHKVNAHRSSAGRSCGLHALLHGDQTIPLRSGEDMAQREKGGRVVFIGNIPYGVSEEQIVDIFGRAGQVLSFRLVYDKETGQPKGFGFLEYADVDAAASAVRNLNDSELNGRTLRVDYSNDNRAGGGNQNQQHQQDGNRAPPPAHFSMPPAPPGALPPLPQGTELPPGLTAFDAISKTISGTPTPQLLDFISQLKNLCAINPAQANQLLTSAPQLGYAVFQAMLLLGLVDTNIVQQLVATAAPAPVAPPPQIAQPPPAQPPPMHYQPPPHQPAYGQYPPAGYAPTPPQPQPAYQPPPQAAQPPPNDQQAQLVQQVLALTRDQIYGMPEAARNQIIALRAQYGAPV